MDPKIMMALNYLEAVQTKPPIETAKKITQFVNYSTIHPEINRIQKKRNDPMHPTYQNWRHEAELEDIFS